MARPTCPTSRDWANRSHETLLRVPRSQGLAHFGCWLSSPIQETRNLGFEAGSRFRKRIIKILFLACSTRHWSSRICQNPKAFGTPVRCEISSPLTRPTTHFSGCSWRPLNQVVPSRRSLRRSHNPPIQTHHSHSAGRSRRAWQLRSHSNARRS